MWGDDDHGANDLAYDSDPGAETGASARVVEDPEVWMDYYSEELVTLWHSLKEQCESMGLAVLDACAFPDFAQFCFKFSSGHPPRV